MTAEQKLKKVDAKLRLQIRLTTDTNRRMADDWRREQQRRQGRGVCTWCGAESCGHLWSRPGDDVPGGQRCCERCSHEPVEGWQHTHTAWDGAVPYPVCAIVMREGDVVYMRRDGVVQFLEMRAPAPGAGIGGAQLDEVPTVAFLGQDGGVGLYVAGEGAPEDVNLWEKKRDLDVVWLPIRVQAAVARDESRRQRLEVEIAEAAAKWEREENERREEEARRRAADIERRQLKHETVTVMRELAAKGAASDPDDDEMDMDGDDREEPETEAPEAPEAAPEPALKLTRAELKQPAPVKKGPGRPKRSKRQRDARKRQKKAWAVQEARQRLEVKRLERLGRSQTPNGGSTRDNEGD